MAKQEKNISKLIQLQASQIGSTLFRNNTGTGWIGKSVREGDKMIIFDPRPLRAGLIKGSSDLIGWTQVVITPEMVGSKVAVFTAIEVKSKYGRVSPDQIKFLRNVKLAGGRCGVARSENEANNIILRNEIL